MLFVARRLLSPLVDLVGALAPPSAGISARATVSTLQYSLGEPLKNGLMPLTVRVQILAWPSFPFFLCEYHTCTFFPHFFWLRNLMAGIRTPACL